MKTPPFIIRDNSVMVVVDGKPYTILDSHPNYADIREALKTKEFDKLKDLVDIPASIATFSKGQVVVRDGVVYYGDRPLHNSLTRRMLSMRAEGFDIDPLIAFLENLMLNPSNRSVEELYTFLEKNDLPITEDGCFLAYKKVRMDYMDIYTGTMDNTPNTGVPVRMLRNKVDDRAQNTCSHGLHFASLSYLPHYSGGNVGSDCRVVILKINPKDVVSIPVDYDHAKGRCCEYLVIGEHTSQEVEMFTKSVYTKDDTVVNVAGTPAKAPKAKPTREDGYQKGSDKGYEDALNGISGKKVKNNGTPYSEGYVAGYADGHAKGVAEMSKSAVGRSAKTVKLYSEYDACVELGISADALRKRAKRGASVEKVNDNGVVKYRLLGFK